VTNLPRVFGFAERETSSARGEGGFPSGGPGDSRPTLMPSFGLFLGVSLLLQGVMTSRDTGLLAAIKMRLFLGSGVSFSLIYSDCSWSSNGRARRGPPGMPVLMSWVVVAHHWPIEVVLAALRRRKCDKRTQRDQVAGNA
jgi:hypothetical protein